MRRLRLLLAIVLASAVGTLPSCGTMGGMRYLAEPAPAAVVTG